MGTHVAKQNQSCTEYCASSLFFWNRNIKEVKHWKRFLRPSGSIILRPLKNVWSVSILVYKSMRSIKARGLIQNVQYLLFRLIQDKFGINSNGCYLEHSEVLQVVFNNTGILIYYILSFSFRLETRVDRTSQVQGLCRTILRG